MWPDLPYGVYKGGWWIGLGCWIVVIYVLYRLWKNRF